MAAYTDVPSMVRARFEARGFSFLPRQPLHSLLSGRRSSRIRGRGLDFEEMRAYVPGDDVRTIDWKATARQSRPFVRVYTEERDRPTIIAVDQRINMFFGTRHATKSALAAEVAALAAWRILDQGDRVGALIFGDNDIAPVKPHRSEPTVLRIFDQIAAKNRALRADFEGQPNPGMLHRVLDELALQARHGHLVIVISDFDGADETTRDRLSRIAQRNDLVLFFLFDRSTVEIPSVAEMVVSDGELQLQLPLGHGAVKSSILDMNSGRQRLILGWQKELGIPVVPLCTWQEPVMQIRKLLGGAAAPGSGR